MVERVSVTTVGLKEFRRDLRKAGEKDVDKRLASDLKSVANRVADDARRRVPQGTGRARRSIKGGVLAKGAYVSGGKDDVPYYGWLDFGSRTPVLGHPRSVGPWTRSGTGPAKGRFIYPAIEENQQAILNGARDAVDRALKESSL